MSSRRHPRRDPLHTTINNWDDGYEYISPAASPGGARPPPPPYYAPQPPEAVPSTRTAKYTPRGVQDDFDAMRKHSPQSNSDSRDAGPRRSRRRSPSPPRRRQRSRDRDERDRQRDRDRPSRHHQRDDDDPASHRAPVRSKTTPTHRLPSPDSSASPPARRSHRRDRGYSASPPPYRRRHHSPAPPRRSRTMHDREPADLDRHHARSSRKDGPPAPLPGAAAAAGAAPKRPGLARSKTTAALGRNASKLLANPQFQAAAVSALQAGGMAALKQWKAPGPWVGKKGGQVATAALGAAALDAFRGGGKTEPAGRGRDDGRRDSGRRSGGGGGGSGGIGGMIGGLLADQLSGGKGRR